MFHRLAEASSSDWTPIMKQSMSYQFEMPERLLGFLRQTRDLVLGFPVNQLTHGLQAATLAERANASDELVLAALCHDVGKIVSIRNHASIAAEMLRPYVGPEVYAVLTYHQHFQLRYTAEHLKSHGIDCRGEARAAFVNEPWYATAETFVDQWDEPAFDPSFEPKPLEHFEPLVRSLCAKPRYATLG